MIGRWVWFVIVIGNKESNFISNKKLYMREKIRIPDETKWQKTSYDKDLGKLSHPNEKGYETVIKKSEKPDMLQILL